MDKIRQSKFQNFFHSKIHLAYLLSFAALLIILYRGINFAEHASVTMDEGTYLLKGKYYLEGRYSVYEEGGPVTNKGPFAFWIPGISQVIAPGLRSGRYFSLLLLMAMLPILWKLVQRFSNAYWAAGILWLFASSGYWISLYSRALSQIITAALIAASLLLLLGGVRRTWELSLGLLLAAVAALTRQNLLPYFGFAVLYVFWQFGLSRKSFVAAGVAFAFFAGIHIVYWPDMYLVLWKPYLPEVVSGFIAQATNILPPGDLGEDAVSSEYALITEVQVLFNAIRIYIAPLLASFCFAILFPWRSTGKEPGSKGQVFVFISFAFLFVFHFLAALLENTFLYSFPVYTGFFLPLGLLLIPISFSLVKQRTGLLRGGLVMAANLLLAAGIGLTFNERTAEQLMNLPAPRLRNMRILPGRTELWRLLENKLHWGYDNLELVVTTAFGLLAGVCILLTGVALWRLFIKGRSSLSLGSWIVLLTLGAGLLLTPVPFFSNVTSQMVCQESVLDRQEAVGHALATILPPGSLIYWEYYTPVLLLYVEDIELFPVQLNNNFYKRIGGDPQSLLRANFWNDEIAEEWMLAADFIILDEAAANRLEPVITEKYYGLYDKLPLTENAIPCIERSYLHIYQKLP